MKSDVRKSFLAVHNNFSADRIVADPDLNASFIAKCRRLGHSVSAKRLNATLLNLRKAGLLKGLPRSKRTSFPNESEYRHAAEIAARFLEHKHSTTIDAILCDPETASEFDNLAISISPGFSPLEYRWAALNLRKAKRLRPELLAQVISAKQVELGALRDIDLTILPTDQGIYIFYSPTETLYIGEATNLRLRLEKHIDHSDNRGLARWLWANGQAQVFLELRVLPPDTTSRVRRALEADLIQSRQPNFNVQRR